MADLHRYITGEYIRKATDLEAQLSAEAAKHDGGAGVIRVDSERCYVPEECPNG